jgi:hypothetical protein
LAEEDYDIYERAIETLNQTDPVEMTMLILLICGVYFAFRGCDEHADLMVSNIELGSYPIGDPMYPLDYIGITNIQDKTHKLS